MATRQSHIAQWRHDRELLALIPSRFPDWQVTVAFYVALHAVDALLSHDNVTSIYSHESRNEVLLRTNRYSFVASKYQPLYDLSRTVRYLADPTRWVPASEVDKNVLRRYLYPLERAVEKLMGVEPGLTPIVLAPAAASADAAAGAGAGAPPPPPPTTTTPTPTTPPPDAP